MPSLFPGMDPYLEEPSLWSDFHMTMIVSMRSALNSVLPEHYVTSADRYVWLHEPESSTRQRLGKPDVFLNEKRDANGGASAQLILEAPATAVLPAVRQEGEPFLRIVDRRSRRVVTVIELLSPANKDPYQDRDDYLAKRREYLATRTNLVEIDLLRGGRRLEMGDPAPPRADYYVVISRAIEFPKIGIWPISVRESLPTIPVPLNPEDGVVRLALQPCLDRTYDEAAYGDDIDYSQPPAPPLNDPDSGWARELVNKRIEGKPH